MKAHFLFWGGSPTELCQISLWLYVFGYLPVFEEQLEAFGKQAKINYSDSVKFRLGIDSVR